MTEETIDHVRTMLESVLADTEDEDTRFKLRTALQYLDLAEAEERALVGVADARAEEADELASRLSELGYID
jgi:hypothetical protein